jgi:hypothetical protein
LVGSEGRVGVKEKVGVVGMVRRGGGCRAREMAVATGFARGEAGTRGAGWSETGVATITFPFF